MLSRRPNSGSSALNESCSLEAIAERILVSKSCHPERYSAKDLASSVQTQILREYAQDDNVRVP